jgi:beta-lactamase class A
MTATAEDRDGALGATVRALAEGLDGRLGVVVWAPGAEGPLVAVEADARFPSASLIKLPILWTVLRAVDGGELDPAERWTLAPEAHVGGTGVLRSLGAGLRPTLLDLATLMIVVSDNTATNALIDRLGIERVNEDLSALGLHGTVLGRRMFDFEARARGLDNWTTPRDTARLLLRFATGEGLSPESTARARTILLGQQLNECLPLRLPFGAAVAHKTGNLPGVHHDAGWLEAEGGRRVVVAALSDGLKNDGDGAVAIARIGEAVASWLVAAPR